MPAASNMVLSSRLELRITERNKKRSTSAPMMASATPEASSPTIKGSPNWATTV